MRDSRGFTLLETIVAVTILSLVGIGVMGAFAAEQRSAIEAHHVVEAAALAQDRIALLTLAARGDLDPLPDSLRHGTFDVPFDDYRWEVDADQVRSQPNLYEVEVRVTWPGDGRFSTRTMLFRPPARDGGG